MTDDFILHWFWFKFAIKLLWSEPQNCKSWPWCDHVIISNWIIQSSLNLSSSCNKIYPMFCFWDDRCEMWHQAGLNSGDQRFLIWTIWENLVSGNLWLMGNTSNNCGNLGGTQQSLYPLPTHTLIKMYNIS